MNPIQCIIGTAGHIDHGKTSLVKALTGTDCDRLDEEKKRGITIDIGFAKLMLPDGRIAGIVDVPGHQKFIHNMLAGATGINLALLVVAADDAVMPQTVEHLAILEILGVSKCVVALTKIDLVDETTLEIAQVDVANLLARTPFVGSEIIPCSVVTSKGIDQVKDALISLSGEAREPWPDAYFRMPIDRVFSVKGHGVVVTGSIFSGSVLPEDRLVLSPGGGNARVRRVQRYGTTVENGVAGTRAALNVAGLNVDLIRRGVVLCHPVINNVFKQFTAEVVCHFASPFKIVHGKSYLLHVHTAETLCSIFLESDKSLEPGQACVAQIRFSDNINLIYGDRFVLRSSSARYTIGGGIILEPGCKPLGRRRLKAVSSKWEALCKEESGVLAVINEFPLGKSHNSIMSMFNMSKRRLEKSLKGLNSVVGSFEWKGNTYVFNKEIGSATVEKLNVAVSEYHKKNPTILGIEESSLAMSELEFLGGALSGYWIRRAVSTGNLEFCGSVIRLKGREAEFSGADDTLRSAILNAYLEGGIKNPPKSDKVYLQLNMDKGTIQKMMRILGQTGDLVSLAPDYTLHKNSLEQARLALVEEVRQNGPVETARFRDILGVGRRVAIYILEYFDKTGVTKRKDNIRVLA